MLEHVRTCWNTFPGGEFSTSKNLVEYGGDISLSKSKSSLPLPLLPLPLLPHPHPPFPLSLGGGKGRGEGGGGRGREGEHYHGPPGVGGDERPPPDFTKTFFYQSFFFKSSKSVLSTYPRGFSQSTAQNYINLWCPLIHSFIVAY